MLLKPFRYHTPTTLEEATDLMNRLQRCQLNAGGTFLLNRLKFLKKKNGLTPEHIVSLRHIPDLQQVEKEQGKLVLGAMMTITDLLRSPCLEGDLNLLKIVGKNVATTPVRNMATLGGNLTCRYTWTEYPSATIALEAALRFRRRDGATYEIQAEEFFAQGAKTEDILTHVVISPQEGALISYQRIRKSPHVDTPLLTVLMKVNVSNDNIQSCRVVVNNGLSFSRRDHVLEEYLRGRPLTNTLIEEVLDHRDLPLYNTRATEYKKHLFNVCLRRAVTEILNQKQQKQQAG